MANRWESMTAGPERPSRPTRRRGTAALGLALGLSACTLHHVRDEQPLITQVDGKPASVYVEQAPARNNGQRLLITVEHTQSATLDGDLGAPAGLASPAGTPIDNCFREDLQRADLAREGRAGLVRSQVRFRCRYPLVQPVVLLTGQDRLPLLGDGGLPLLARRPWLLSGFVRGELAIPTTGAGESVDLGVNLGLRGLAAERMHLGGRGDVLVNTLRGSASAVFGPELGYVQSRGPCARCSFEATASYLVGYMGGLAHGPELDLRAGVRLARTGVSWHGVEGGVGFRYLFGGAQGAPGGAVVLTLSYALMTALRGAPLPTSLRARPAELQPEYDAPQSEPQRRPHSNESDGEP